VSGLGYNIYKRGRGCMSIREMIKHNIDLMPEEALPAVSEFIRLVYKLPIASSVDYDNTEKGYQILVKNKKRVFPVINEKIEKLDYLDKKYGCID
jgi:hypothetical protein